MENPRNPFILGHKLQRPYFCDRFEEQKLLTSAVVNGRNVVLISPRRMGKTSLVYLSINDSDEIKDTYLTFFFDILQTNSLAEFTYLLGRTVFDTLASRGLSKVKEFIAALKSVKGSFGFDALSGTPTFNLQLGDLKYPEYTLEEIFGYIENSPKPVIMVIDEFQQITKYPEKNTEALLRSHIQQLANVSFIFAGSEQSILREMFLSSKRPFYNSTEVMHLNPIPEDLYVEFAQQMFASRERQVESEPIRMSFRLFDGNTFYLQRTMNGAFADTLRGETCGYETIRRSIKAMLAANEVVYQEMLSNVSISQKMTLYAIAQERIVAGPTSGAFIKKYSLSSASAVQSALLKLSKFGIIVKTPNGYTLTDPLLRIFINSLFSSPEI